MNILQIVPELKFGGVERGTVDLARYLAKQGHKSVVVSAGGPLVGDLTSAGVIHYALPVQKKSIFSVLYSVKVLAKIIRKEQIQLIHARSRVPALIAYWAGRRCQIPFITTCHGFYRRHPLSCVMGWGKLVIVASHLIGKRMHDDFGVAHERIRLIHRGVNLEEFRPTEVPPADPPAPVVGLIGRMTPIKGHEVFLKAMARVVRVLPQVKIQLIGDAPKPQYKEDLMMLAKQLGLAGHVEFLGTRYDIAKQLSQMTVLAAPSVGEEAFGRVVIEAGACGAAVVASRIGGMVEIIEDEKNGLLVAPNDPRVLADAVLRLLKDPALRQRLSGNLKKKVQAEFNLDRMFERTLSVYEEALKRQKILVIKLTAIGDVILIIPSLAAIRQKYPAAWITVLVSRKARKIIRNCPYVNDVIVYEDSAKWRVLSWFKMARLLAREQFDTVADLQNNRASHFISFFCGAGVRAGFSNRKWSFFLNRRSKGSLGALPPLEHQLQVLKMIGVDAVQKTLELWTSPEEEQRIDSFLASHWVSQSQHLVGMNPGSSLRWPTKQWPIENFARVCDELGRRNIRVVLTGSADDLAATEELVRRTKYKPINAAGKTSITELAALIKRCRVFVSSDSAPMHIASGVQVPLIAIFGPTDPKRHLVPPSRYQVFWKEAQCSPCYLRSCPLGHVCMRKITVQEVLDAVLYFIHEKRSVLEPQHSLS
jgi:lipopolysaccharide heptosyltransferase II